MLFSFAKSSVRKSSIAAALVMGFAASPVLQASEPSILGNWSTGSEGGKVQIYRCGTSYCGKIIDAVRLRADPNLLDVRNKDSNLRGRKLKGLNVLTSFSGGPTVFKGGPVYDPETGDGASRGELKLLPSGKLEVKGCVSIFCRTKIWTRAD